jgi:UDP-N-acetylmuramyl pentapeptide phosphotransferase/UDP-N-acetylglucosamine-1-phosphate transferase
MAWFFILLLIVYVGAINIVNFMDGINGMTVSNSIAVLIPLYIVNNTLQEPFIPNSFIIITLLAVLVFGIFNFRPEGKAKCFAGDVGSISIAYILLFILGRLIVKTNDFTWLILLLVYGVDGCLTICHRIILHENLVKAHRKHIYQLMANELKIGHLKISILYMVLQLIISIGFIFLCPNTESYHWRYLTLSVIIVSVAYLFFKCKYFYLYKDSSYKTRYR